ncbi:MAG: hypothetical protein U9R68_03765 [Planctomycetota bacterium]|nr:hypothetical protein [Planctomycetota bacterium]
MITAVASRLALLALDPIERWSAARNLNSFHWSALGRPTVWIPMLVVGALGVATVVVYRRHRLRRALLAAFGRAASQADLATGERTMLARIAEVADPRPLTDAHALASAFEEGVQQVMANRTTQRLTPEARRRVQDVIASVRIKLGFAPSAPSAPADAALSRDDRVTLARPGARPDVGATVIGIGGVNVTVRLDEPFALRVGGAAVLRQVRGSIQLEHNLAVTQVEDNVVHARLIGSPTRKNLRRFVRVPICRPVHVARYGFVHEGSEGSVPEFVVGTLYEIAGPGLRLGAEMDVDVGERILVVLDLGREGSLRAVGVIRRRVASEGGGPADFAVELAPVTEEEVARLVKETNAAARRAADNPDAAGDDHATTSALNRTTG